MSRYPTLSSSEDHSFDHPLISAMAARRQFAISAALIAAFAIIICVNWLA